MKIHYQHAHRAMGAISQAGRVAQRSVRLAAKGATANALGQKMARNTMMALGAFAAGLSCLAAGAETLSVAPFCLSAALVAASVRMAVRVDCLDDEFGR